MKKLKCYKVIREYQHARLLDICIARDEEEVYAIMCWTKEDTPSLQIEELPLIKSDCICSEHLVANKISKKTLWNITQGVFSKWLKEKLRNIIKTFQLYGLGFLEKM